jgi:coatomer subunit beta'
VTVCGDGEYVIYTALAWRNKSFGAALDFGWSVDSSEFAVRESPSKIRIFNQFKEKTTFRPHFAAEGLYGGVLLGLRSTDFICFYDWAESRVIRRIDVSVKDVWWSESGEFVAIASDSSFFILRYNARVTAEALQSGEVDESEGVEDAFEVLIEIGEVIRTAVWVGDCFIYNNADWRLNYCVGGEVTTIFHLDRPMYLLGYLAAQNRVYLIDKEFSVVSYTLSLSLIDYKTLILRGEVDAAEEVLPTIPLEQHNNIARFLESRGFMADALRVATDPDYRFELAIQLGDLGIARGVIDHELTTSVSNKWKQLGELAMSMGDICLASTCLMNAGDLSGQLLLCSASASADKLEELAILASELGKHNVAFICLFLLNKIDDCIELLCSTGRIPEAAFMSRTYAPSKVSGVVDIWKADLALVNRKAADALADPDEYKNLFPNFDIALQAEGKSRLSPASLRKPARCFGEHENIPLPKLIEKVEELEVGVNLRVGADDQTQVPLEMIDTGLVDDDDFSSNSELISTSSAAAVDETAAKMHLSGGKAVSSDSDD